MTKDTIFDLLYRAVMRDIPNAHVTKLPSVITLITTGRAGLPDVTRRLRVSDETLNSLLQAGTITGVDSARMYIMSSGAHTRLANGEDVDL